MYHNSLKSKTLENWVSSRKANEAVKRIIVIIKACHYRNVSDGLEAREGERAIYRLTKARRQQTEDNDRFYGVNDERGTLLTDHAMVKNRWKEHFQNVSNKEFTHPPIPQIVTSHALASEVSAEEVKIALSRIKSGKP